MRNILILLWHLLKVIFAFSLFGFGSLVLFTFLWFFILKIVVRDKAKRAKIAQKSVKVSFSLFLKILKLLNIIDYEFNGLDKIRREENCIYIANHPSLLDVLLLLSVIPNCSCVVKDALLKNWFVGNIIRTADYIPNTHGDEMLDKSNQVLNSKGSILIFPEGTRTNFEQPMQLKRGAANIALRCNADIRVIHIKCTPVFLSKGQKWYKIPRKGVFKIDIGDKIPIKQFQCDHFTLASRRLTNILTTILCNN